MERVRGGVNAVFSLFIHSHTQKQVCAYVCIRKMQISGCETSLKTELLQNRLSSTFPCASFCYLVYLSRLFNIFYLILYCSHFLTKKHATRHKQGIQFQDSRLPWESGSDRDQTYLLATATKGVLVCSYCYPSVDWYN